MDKSLSTKVGDAEAHFTFWVTNTSPGELLLNNVSASCGCTTLDLAPFPWKLPSGTVTNVKARVDIKGKSGTLAKTLMVISSAGQQTLVMRITIPKDPNIAKMEREANMAIAKADRQAVFRGDCARCHFTPALFKKGEDLFASTCAICHDPATWAKSATHDLTQGAEPDTHHRNEMVSDLATLKTNLTKEAWKTIIAGGGTKPGSLMPAFAKQNGGPLSAEQIDGLVEYVIKKFPFKSATAKEPAPKADIKKSEVQKPGSKS